MANSTFADYDMSSLIKNSALLVSRVVEKKIDVIDGYISKMELDKHPEVLEQLIEELGLQKFWETINGNPETYSVVRPLAVNRMLNFYEGGIRCSLPINQIRIGMVVCAMISTALPDHWKSNTYLGLNSNLFCFAPSGVCSLDEIEMKSMKEEDGKMAEKIVRAFSKGKPVNYSGYERLVQTLTNAVRMWIVSDDQDVINIMTAPGHLTEHLNVHALRNHWILRSIAQGGLRSRTEIINFTTNWASAKSTKLNAVGRYQNLLNREVV